MFYNGEDSRVPLGDDDDCDTTPGIASAIKHPPRLNIKSSGVEARDAAAVIADKDQEGDNKDTGKPTDANALEPADANVIDAPEQYNPFNYCYRVMIEELNMELLVRFVIETLDHDQKHPIQFIRDGVAHTIPFFPREQEGADPADKHIQGELDLNSDNRHDEHPYYIIPVVHRAKVLGDPLANDGKGSTDVLITKELVISEVSPERLAEAIEELRADVQSDPSAPAGLHDLLSEALGYKESWSDSYRTAGESLGWDEGENEAY